MFLAFALLAVMAAGVPAGTLEVAAGGSIQAAIDAATPGDVVRVAAGMFPEDLDFRGKAITVLGAGPSTVVVGTGTGPVVRFTSGEAPASILDSLTITGGLADAGGGILILNSRPTVRRTIVARNAARARGSGVYLEGSAAELSNNVVVFNRTADPARGDAHSVQLLDSPARLINNTIAYGDSNGLLIRGGSAAVIMNNVIARNGSRVDGQVRGRGICDFSDGATIQYNLFHRNLRAALLTGTGADYRRIRRAERTIGDPRLAFNRDGSPGFIDASAGDLRPGRRARARGAGNPDPLFANPDGTRNDLGFTGGPLAPTWSGRALRAAL